MNISLIQLDGFKKSWKRLGLNDDDLRMLEAAIRAQPDGPPVMKGSGGLRKIRFASAHSSSGKSGGHRVCYAYFSKYGLVYLFAVFVKNVRANLGKAELNDYRQLIEALERLLQMHFAKGQTP